MILSDKIREHGDVPVIETTSGRIVMVYCSDNHYRTLKQWDKWMEENWHDCI